MIVYIYLAIAVSIIVTILYIRKQLNKPSEPAIQVIAQNDTKELLAGIKEIVASTKEKVVPKPQPILRRYRVLISSSERDKTLYPNTSDYWLKLPEPVFGLQRIQMIDGSFPLTLELINDNNNQLTITLGYTGSTPYVIDLTDGIYNGTELASMIETRINAYFTANPLVLVPPATTQPVFTVSYDTTTGLILFSVNFVVPSTPSAAVNRFTLTGNSYLNEILGLTTTTSNYDVVWRLQGTTPVNVTFKQNIMLDLSTTADDFNTLQIAQRNDSDVRCFAFIPLPSGSGFAGGGYAPSAATISGAAILVESASATSGYGTFNFVNAYYEAWGGPKSMIQLIHVQLKNLLPDNSVVTADFNNAEHTLELELTARLDKSSQNLS